MATPKEVNPRKKDTVVSMTIFRGGGPVNERNCSRREEGKEGKEKQTRFDNVGC